MTAAGKTGTVKGRMPTGWETVRWIATETATVAFADGAMTAEPDELLPINRRLGWRVVYDFQPFGIPMVALNTTEDNDYPVEVARGEEGEPVTVRICVTNDVDELDGKGGGWRTVGRLETPSGTLRVLDPFMRGEKPYSFAMAWPYRTNTVQVFRFRSEGMTETIGIKLLGRKERAMPKRRTKLEVELPPWPTKRVKNVKTLGLTWRREIARKVKQAARKEGVERLEGLQLEVEVQLFLGDASLERQDVDNIAKHVFDALQGTLGGRGTKVRTKGALLPNDANIQRLTIVKKPIRSTKAKSRLILRDYALMERVRARGKGTSPVTSSIRAARPG